MRFLNYTFATGLGVGYAPLAPGTAGSLLGAVSWFALNQYHPDDLSLLILVLLVSLIGVYSSTQVEKEKGPDPSIVVIDEVAGQWISYLFLPVNLTILISGFVLFRLFDIWKPFPIDQSQRLKNGWGIMADDLLAGIFTNLILQIAIMTGIFSGIH